MTLDNNLNKAIDIENINKICRGNKSRINLYLTQFLELITTQKKELCKGLEMGDAKKIRDILHQMHPQLQFFKVQGVEVPIRRIVLDHQSIPWNDLEIMVNNIISKLDEAITYVEHILNLRNK